METFFEHTNGWNLATFYPMQYGVGQESGFGTNRATKDEKATCGKKPLPPICVCIRNGSACCNKHKQYAVQLNAWNTCLNNVRAYNLSLLTSGGGSMIPSDTTSTGIPSSEDTHPISVPTTLNSKNSDTSSKTSSSVTGPTLMGNKWVWIIVAVMVIIIFASIIMLSKKKVSK